MLCTISAKLAGWATAMTPTPQMLGTGRFKGPASGLLRLRNLAHTMAGLTAGRCWGWVVEAIPKSGGADHKYVSRGRGGLL